MKLLPSLRWRVSGLALGRTLNRTSKRGRSSVSKNRFSFSIRNAVAAAVLAGSGASVVHAQAGLDALIERLGEEQVPTGAGVIVGMVEAPTSAGNYMPNGNHPELSGAELIAMSGSSGASGHATTVARNFFGSVLSIAPGIPTAHVWETNDWIQGGGLRVGQGTSAAPIALPDGLRVLNHSWIGDVGNFNNEAIRRADFAAARDQVLFVVGLNNEPGQVPLLGHMYNAISVGVPSGNHATGDTMSGIDGPGRMKPEIVAPGNLTSWSTPMVSAAGALLVETAKSDPALAPHRADALRIDVVRAVLLAGADHQAGWSNQPVTSGPQRGVTSRPLDETFGAGHLNIDRSHRILTGSVVDGIDQTLPDQVAGHAGWGRAELATGQSRYWRFQVAEDAEEVSILAAWNRAFGATFNAPTSQVTSLTLWRVDERGELASLVGAGGEAFFATGNVVSQSTVDNLQHLYLTDLKAGEYVLEAARNDLFGGSRELAVAWLFPEPPDDGAPGIVGDLNGDGVVNVFDLLILLDKWGSCADPEACPADLNRDGTVNVFDLLILLDHWG